MLTAARELEKIMQLPLLLMKNVIVKNELI
jgi:hypothetical protein